MNSVLFWNSVALEASRRDFTRGYVNNQQPGPIATSRALAIVHLAIHDAVAFQSNPNAAYLHKKGEPAITVTGPVDDVIAGAAVTTLKKLYPAYEALFDDSVGGVNQAAFNSGVAVGNAILNYRTNDGSGTAITVGQPSNPGYGVHRADPYSPGQTQLGPKWGDVKRFGDSAHQLLEAFPGFGTTEFLQNDHYHEDFAEVRDYGSATRKQRSAEQERLGVFWGYDGANNLGVPPRLYNQVVRAAVKQLAPNLNRARLAELFAVVNVAMADAGIDAWHYKYKYNLWRPVIGIRSESAPDGDPFWAPLGAPQTNAARATVSPGFPAYPSGHATFGAAVMQSLRLTLHNSAGPISVQDVLNVEQGLSAPLPAETFTVISDELDGVSKDADGSTRQLVPITFNNFVEPVWENSVSRIYLGVHWRFDGIPRSGTKKIGGVPLGLAVGQEAHALFNESTSLGGSV